MTTQLTNVISPRDWHDIETRAWHITNATSDLTDAVHMQWVDPSGRWDREVIKTAATCAKLGLTEDEIGHIIWNTRKEILDGT